MISLHLADAPPRPVYQLVGGPSYREAKGGALRPGRVAERWDKFPASRVWLRSSAIRSRPLPLLRSDSDGSCSITNPPDAPPIHALPDYGEYSGVFSTRFCSLQMLKS